MLLWPRFELYRNRPDGWATICAPELWPSKPSGRVEVVLRMRIAEDSASYSNAETDESISLTVYSQRLFGWTQRWRGPEPEGSWTNGCGLGAKRPSRSTSNTITRSMPISHASARLPVASGRIECGNGRSRVMVLTPRPWS